MTRRGLRWKFNAALLPVVAATVLLLGWLDARHERDAVMAAHAFHAQEVSDQSATAAIEGGAIVRLEAFAAVGVDVDIVDQEDVDRSQPEATVGLLDRAHDAVAAEIVGRPTAVSCGGKGHPGGVHGVSELLWRVGSKKRLSPVAERVEHEGNLKRVARAEESVELR